MYGNASPTAKLASQLMMVAMERANDLASRLNNSATITHGITPTYIQKNITWQSQVENGHYSTLECFIEITPDFLCPFMND